MHMHNISYLKCWNWSKMIYMLLQSILHRVYFWNKLSQAVTTGDTGAQYSETAHDITLAALRMVAVYDWLLSPTMPPQDW